MRHAVIGAGSWGTALAIQLARCGVDVRLWGRDADAMRDMIETRRNRRYLPDAEFPSTLTAVVEFDAALDGVDDVLIAVPSHAFRATLERVGARVAPERLNLVWATKGLEIDTGLLPHEVLAQVLPACGAHAVMSGPTFAKEVATRLPTAITVASPLQRHAERVANAFADERFRTYTADDMIAVEVGGAVKNALAIGAGLSDGLGFGANARVALINRGLREMMRFGLALGARAESFMGLATMGDLVLTCTDDQSRNRRMGLALARGLERDAAEREIGQVVEGVFAARAVHEKAVSLGIVMPIVEQIHRVLFDGATPTDAVAELMSRETGPELGDIEPER